MKPSIVAAALCATSLSFFLSACSSSDGAVTPAITTQPASMTIATDTNGVLSIVASGANLQYQWYKDGAAIAGAASATYTVTESGAYYVVVTDSSGSVTSANAVVTVTGAPVLTTQPASATILTDTAQTLTVEASGAGLTYQWYRDGAPLDGATGMRYAATTGGNYTVVVTNLAGSTTSAVAIIEVSSTATVPVIATQPAGQTVNAGTGVAFTVAATGASLSYQWFKDGTAIAGATQPGYKIAAASAASAGAYTVSVSNSAGAVASSSASLGVNAAVAGANTANVVNAATAFLATLSASQKAVATISTDSSTVLSDFSLANAIQWTNLPGERHGLRLNASTLSAAQLAAANRVIATALSPTGLTLLNELRLADDVLATPATSATAPAMPGGVPPGGAIPGGTPPAGTAPVGAAPGGGAGGALSYGAGLYSIAFVGTPSATAPWMLQLIGHHLAYNITYNAGVVSATPTFVGVEPPNWSVAGDGAVTVTSNAATSAAAHAPMEKQRAAVYSLAESIYADSTTSAAARLPGTFTDVLMGAVNNSDANFKTLAYPASARGAAYSTMNAAQKLNVKAAIEAWVSTQAVDVAATLLSAYLSDDALAATYVGYGVGQNGTKADFSAYPNSLAAPLDAQHSYLRIDGPRVWIEIVVQEGIGYRNNVHYHTIWRDKTADYGGRF